MQTFTEGNHDAEFLLSEANGSLSREAATVKTGAGVLPAGAVLSLEVASGKYVKYDNATAAAGDKADAVLYAGVDATDEDAPCVLIARLAEVKKSALTWHGLAQGAIDAGLADLAAQHIIGR